MLLTYLLSVHQHLKPIQLALIASISLCASSSSSSSSSTMANEQQHQQQHLFGSISKSVNTLLYLNHVYRFLFFVIGISLGFVISLYLKNCSFTTPVASPSVPFASTNGSFLSNNASFSLGAELRFIKHNMSDDELLQKATSSSSSSMVQNNNVVVVAKVAFMFLTKGSLPLAPLWEKFFDGHEGFYSIYVHTHPSYNETIPESSVFYGRRIPSQPVYWGTPTMIEAERRLLANALLDISNQRFVLLSESCIPLFNFTTIYNYLINSNLSFLGSYDDPRKVGRGRYNPNMSPSINITNWRKGSQWFEVHRDLAHNIVSDTKYFAIFKEHCVPPCYSDEHYIPTLVNILYADLNSNRSITWVDWSRGGPHPGKFGGNHITDEFLNQIRYGSECLYNGNTSLVCNLFARKFLPNALEPLLRVGPLVIGFNP